MRIEKNLSSQRSDELLRIIQSRFEKHPSRHASLRWSTIQERLQGNPEKLWSLNQMEETGGEPDVIDYNAKTKEITFVDCSIESPIGRRSLCYDSEALESRKTYKPENSAQAMAEEMGISILTEAQYQVLQQLGNFDTKTSSWLMTPNSIREKGGAIFGDWRFGRVFIYHNGAESYYKSRGFRGLLKI